MSIIPVELAPGIPVVQWNEIAILAGLFVSFAIAAWVLRHEPAKSAWAWAFCALLGAGSALLIAEKLPPLLPFARCLSSLFPFFLLVGALRSAGRGVPRWLVTAGIGVMLGRAGFQVAGLEVGTSLLALLAEPLAAGAAAVIYHRHVVPQRASQVSRLIVPVLLLVAALEARDALWDLSLGGPYIPWITWTAVGGILATLLITSAIEESRRREMIAVDALREAEWRFRQLSEHSKDLIAEIHADGKVTYVSPNLRGILGYEPEEFLGTDITDVAESLRSSKLTDRRGRPAVLTYLKKARRFAPIGLAHHKDGTPHWFETRGVEYRSADGESRSLVISRDVSERVAAEQERRRLEAKIQQARRLESLGILAGGIAHDFNNLLVGVLLNAEILLEDLESDSPLRPQAEGIKQASDRASELTQQLLAYAGKAHVSPETFDLGVLVGELAQLLRAHLPETAELRVELEGETSWVHADATQVRQVVMNLITNAGEALDGKSGVVIVRTGTAQLDQGDLERCSFAEELDAGEYAYVEVSDTGRGIEAEKLGKIFDPFFTTKFQGRGLGLAAVTGIVRSHGGAVRVESEPGEGMRFRVFLPLSAKPAVSTEETSVPSGWQGRGTILVVDDEEMVRNAAGLMVERLGFGVLSASDGAEGVELFRKNQSDVSCVLLDVTMPVMDGEETFWALREIREDVPVLFMSGHSSRDIDSRLLGKSRVEKLRKPFHRADLEGRLRELLETG